MSDMNEAPDVAAMATAEPLDNLDLLAGVALRLSVEVGSVQMKLADLLALGAGSVVELDRQADDQLDVFANGTLIARGEIVAVDGRYALRVTDIVSPPARGAGERRA